MLYTCMGLVYPAERVHELVPHLLPLMRTRPEGRGTLSKGYYAGLSAGLAEGAVATTRRLALTVGTSRMSEPLPEIRRVLDALTNLERLEQIAARVRTATWLAEAPDIAEAWSAIGKARRVADLRIPVLAALAAVQQPGQGIIHSSGALPLWLSAYCTGL